MARGKEVAVTVAVRARPLLAKERAEGSRSCVVADSVRKEVLVGADRLFSYTCVLGPEASQGDVYHKLSVRRAILPLCLLTVLSSCCGFRAQAGPKRPG